MSATDNHVLGLCSDQVVTVSERLPVNAVTARQEALHVNTASPIIKPSPDTPTSAISTNSSQKQLLLVGPDGQVCATQAVLDAIVSGSLYTHIPGNIFRGGANGQIRSECMWCECRYDPQTSERDEACGPDSDCINRALCVECPANCPNAPFCQNQRYLLLLSDRLGLLN